MKLIVTYYDEDLSWISCAARYCDVEVISKGGRQVFVNPADRIKVVPTDNGGGNQLDILRTIVENYESFPDRMAFCQGWPFDHCMHHQFYESIMHERRGPLEKLDNPPKNSAWRYSEEVDGGFVEINNSWYITHLNKKYSGSGGAYNGTSISSFDDFMFGLFANYKKIKYVRFSPGSQYIVSCFDIWKYPIEFWEALGAIIPKSPELNGGVEAHVIERALFHIFYGLLCLRVDYKDYLNRLTSA